MGRRKFKAVRAGFEPAVRFPVRQFSKLVVSASHPPHLRLLSPAKVQLFYLLANFFVKLKSHC
jgi:hypothetical protein